MQHDMSLPPPRTGCALRARAQSQLCTQGRVLGPCPPGRPGADAGLVRKVA